MAFKHIITCGVQKVWWWVTWVILGKKPVSTGHVGDSAFLRRQKNPYHHIRSTRWCCLWLCIWYQIGKLVKKEKYMISRLCYGNFQIIPHISSRPISAWGPLALRLIWIEGWDGVWYKYHHIIIPIYPIVIRKYSSLRTMLDIFLRRKHTKHEW